MGSGQSTSSSNSAAAKERKVLRDLGERYPFSDDELRTLLQCYTYLVKNTKSDGSSSFFLMDLLKGSIEAMNVTASAVDTTEASKNGMELLVKTVEYIKDEDILSIEFANRLKTLACVPNQISSNNTTTTNEEPLDVTNYELGEFLNGISKLMGRSGQGTRQSLELIFSCCSNVKDNNNEYANSNDLVSLAYRIGLSTFLLGQQIKKHQQTLFESNYGTSNVASGNDDDDNSNNNNDDDDDENDTKSLTYQLPTSLEMNDILNNTKEHTSLESLSRSLYDAECNGIRSVSLSPSTCLSSDKNDVTVTTFISWVDATCPLLAATIPTLLHYLIFSFKKFSPSRQPFLFPNLSYKQKSFLFNNIYSSRLFTFSTMSLSLGGAWHRLYTTEADGLSFNRLQLSLLGYGGPTLLIIEAVDGGIFGAYTSTAWKESKDFYGNFDCFLFQLEPITRIFRPRGIERNFMYCNSTARSKGYDQLAHGIGFGGNNKQPRLYISETFEDCYAGISDTTFEPGALLPPNLKDGSSRKYFEIETLEVWGCGGDEIVKEALEKRIAARAVMDANIRKAKKVDKAAFLDDLNSGLIESKAFKHKDEIRGREGGCDL